MVNKIKQSKLEVNEQGTSVPVETTEVKTSYQPYRPKVVIDAIAAFLEEYKEPGYIYKGVATNYRTKPTNVLDHEKAGYEIVYSTATFKDERCFTPDNNKSESTVPGPVMKTTADGIQYILMRISEERAHQNDLDRVKADAAKYKRSVKNISRTGNTVKVNDGEILYTNPNGDINNG